MRNVWSILILSAFSLWSACGGSGSSGERQEGTDTTGITADTGAAALPGEAGQPAGLRAQHQCRIPGQVLEGNQFWIREKEILVCIVADSTTYDADYGDSHRILEVYDTRSCERISRTELPVNESPDFPYYIAEITYNTVHQLVGIRGAKTIYCYDVENRQLLPVLKPQFLSERYGADAQSGMIQRLEVWEDFLIGYAQDEGVFTFNISDKRNPRAILPIAEYEIQEMDYHPLFAFPFVNETVQLAIPTYDIESSQFNIHPLFERPQSLDTTLSRSARNNRFIVLRRRDEARTGLAIDMLNLRLVDLPANIATQKTQDILNWLRTNNR